MTDIGNNCEAVSSFLTETASCPRQSQGGKIYNCRIQLHGDIRRTNLRLKLYDDEAWLCPICGKTVRPNKDGNDATDDEWRDYFLQKERDIQELQKTIDEKRLTDKAQKKHQAYELGAREFTLTYSPKWMNDSEARIAMGVAIKRLLGYYENDIIELRAVGEVGSNGLSHIHCFYKLKDGLKMKDKNFKRAWKWWNPKKPMGRGFEGGHHANVKCESDFKGYIDKEVDNAWLEVTIDNRDK